VRLWQPDERAEPQFVFSLAFGEVENGPDPGVAMGRDEGARPLGDGVAWHVSFPDDETAQRGRARLTFQQVRLEIPLMEVL